MAANFVPDGIEVIVKARRGNTGIITVGNSSGNALNTSGANFALQANQSVSLQITNTNLIWIDSTVAAEGTETVFEF